MVVIMSYFFLNKEDSCFVPLDIKATAFLQNCQIRSHYSHYAVYHCYIQKALQHQKATGKIATYVNNINALIKTNNLVHAYNLESNLINYTDYVIFQRYHYVVLNVIGISFI